MSCLWPAISAGPGTRVPLIGNPVAKTWESDFLHSSDLDGLANPLRASILVLMAEQINHFDGQATIPFLDGPYREVLDLLEQARRHAVLRTLPHRRPSNANGSDGIRRAKLSCEALRITSRLSQCLAWLMVQKAINAGELPPEAALDPDKRLDGKEVCEVPGAEDDPEVPPELRNLLVRSRHLYERVARLDNRLAEQARVVN